jgi:hypothetical protein
VSRAAKNEFWAIVKDCLREFHGMNQRLSQRKAKELRDAIERMKKSAEELFYHSEPFDVANDIAGKPLDAESHRDRYVHIRDEKHGNGISKQYLQERHKVKTKN